MKRTIIIVIAIVAPLSLAHAQSDGSAGSIQTTSTPVATSAASSSVSASSISTSTPRTLPRQPKPKTSAPAPVPAPRATSTALIPTSTTTPAQAAPPSADFMTLIGILIVGTIGGLVSLGMRLYRKNKNQQSGDSDDGQKCDSIKQLLEAKKKELEDMIRGWPEDKLKALAGEKIAGTFARSETAKQGIEIAQDVKEKYGKLQSTIELLEKRYDLCMLSLPEMGAQSYEGTIIESSLTDPAILQKMNVLREYVAGDWRLNDVRVNERQIKKMGGYLNDGPWYMYFWQPGKDETIVVFKEKQFTIKQSNPSTWRDAIAYGVSKGIPESQLDFKRSE